MTAAVAETLTFKSIDAVGVYVLPDGSIVKVQTNKKKSSVYSMVWQSNHGARLTLTGEHVNAEWFYAPEILITVTPEMRMNLDQAKQFIILYGRCAKCSRRLKAAKSVEAGIGPTCIKYFSI